MTPAVATVGLIVVAMWVVFTVASGEPGPIGVVERPATVVELTGPWRAQPVRLDPIMALEVEHVCREDSEFPDGVRLVLVDARGTGRLPAVFAGEDSMAECVYMEVDANGIVTGSLSSIQHGLGVAARPGKLSPGNGASIDGAGVNGWSFDLGPRRAGHRNGRRRRRRDRPDHRDRAERLILRLVARRAASGSPARMTVVTGLDAAGVILDRVTQ